MNLKSKNKYLLITIACLFAILLTSTVLADNPQQQSMALSETEINQQMQNLPEWTRDEAVISRTFGFQDFVAAIDFVNQLVAPAESAGHHPDLTISYNKVTVSLTTHDAGGLTDKDFALAQQISELAN